MSSKDISHFSLPSFFSSSLFFFVSQLYTRYFDSSKINRVSSNLMIFDHSISVVEIRLDERGNFVVR